MVGGSNPSASSIGHSRHIFREAPNTHGFQRYTVSKKDERDSWITSARAIARRRIKSASQTNEFPGRWRSGQSQQTVNLPPLWLRRFEPSPPLFFCAALIAALLESERASLWSVGEGAKSAVARWACPRSVRSEAVVDRRVSEREGGSNSVVESQPSKLLVAGSIPVSRSRLRSLALLASFDSACRRVQSVAPKLAEASEGRLQV